MCCGCAYSEHSVEELCREVKPQVSRDCVFAFGEQWTLEYLESALAYKKDKSNEIHASAYLESSDSLAISSWLSGAVS